MCMHKVSLMWSYNSTDIYVHCMKEVKKGNKISLVIQKFIKNKLSKNYMHMLHTIFSSDFSLNPIPFLFSHKFISGTILP